MSVLLTTKRHSSSVAMTTTTTHQSQSKSSSPAPIGGGSSTVSNPTVPTQTITTIPSTTTTTTPKTTPKTMPKTTPKSTTTTTTKAPIVVPPKKTTTQNIVKPSTTTPHSSTAAVLPSTNGKGGGGSGVNLGLAIGLPVLFLVILVVLVVLFICWRRRKKQKMFSPEEPNHNDTKRKGKPEIYIRTPSREGTQLYVVRHAFNATDDKHLTLTIGQFVQVLEKERDGWMRGTIDDEKEGWFPASCVNKLACVDQPTFSRDNAKLELDETPNQEEVVSHKPVPATRDLRKSTLPECESLEDEDLTLGGDPQSDRKPGGALKAENDEEGSDSQSFEDVDLSSARDAHSDPTEGALNSDNEEGSEVESLEDVGPLARHEAKPELSETQKMEGFVNQIFQVEDEDGDQQQSVNNEKRDSAPDTVEVTFAPTQPVAAPREHTSKPVVETEVKTELAETEGDQLETSGDRADGGKGKMTLPLDLRLSLVPDGKLYLAEDVFTPTSPNHLRLGKGDVLRWEDEKGDWMKGANVKTGETGWFPSEYVSEKDAPQELDLKSEETAVTQMEHITPTVVCAVTQAPVESQAPIAPVSVTELADKGNDVTATEHSNDEAHSLEKTVPGIHVKETSDDLGPPSPDSGFESPRQIVKPVYEDQGTAAPQATSQETEDPETSHNEKKLMPEIPTRFVTPKLVKIVRKPSDSKNAGHHENLSEPVAQHQREDSVKDTPEHSEDTFRGATTSDGSNTRESIVDDFMNRTPSPEIEQPEPAVAEDIDTTEVRAVSPEPGTSPEDKPDVPTKPARLKFWNKRPKSLKQLLHVNLPGSGRKHRGTDPELSHVEEKDRAKSPQDSLPEVTGSVSPKEKPPRPSRPPTSPQSPVNGDLPSPSGKPPKPPRPTSPPMRSPSGKAENGFHMVSTDTDEKDRTEEAGAASPDSGDRGMVDEVNGKVDSVPEHGQVEEVVNDSLGAAPVGDVGTSGEELEPIAADGDAEKEAQDEVVPSSPLVNDGDVEQHENRDDVKEDEVSSPTVAVDASDEFNKSQSTVTPNTTVEDVISADTTLTNTPEALTGEPTPVTDTPEALTGEPAPVTANEHTLQDVSNDNSLPDEEVNPELPGAVDPKPEQSMNPDQSEDVATVDSELPAVEELPGSSEMLSPVSTEKDTSSDVHDTPSPTQHSPDTSSQEPNVSPLRFFTPAGFVPAPSSAKRELDFSAPLNVDMLPNTEEVNAEDKVREGGKEPVSPLRFFTPAGFVPGSPSPKQEVDISVSPVEPMKAEDTQTEGKPSDEGERDRDLSPYKLFTPAGFVPRSPSPVPVSPSAEGAVKKDEVLTVKTDDQSSDRKKDDVSPLRFFTPPAFAPQHGHYSAIQLPDSVVGDRQDRVTEETPPGQDDTKQDREDGYLLTEDNKEVEQTDSDTVIPSHGDDTQKHSDDTVTHSNDDDTHPIAMSNGDTSPTNDTKVGKDVADDNSMNTSLSSDTDIDTRLRFFTPAQFTPFNSHPDKKISPVHAPTSKTPEDTVTQAKETVTESPKETLELPNEPLVPPTETVEPPKETVEPPKETIEPPTETVEPPKETIEPSNDATDVSKSEIPNPSDGLHIVTSSSPEEQWKGINGDTEDSPPTKTFSSPPLSPPLFTATGYSSPKTYQPFHKFNLGSSPLAEDTKGVSDEPPSEAPPALPEEAPPPLPDCPPPPLDDY